MTNIYKWGIFKIITTIIKYNNNNNNNDNNNSTYSDSIKNNKY